MSGSVKSWRKSDTLSQRLLKFIQPNEAGCWEWTGCLSGGYGRLTFHYKTDYAHRWVMKAIGVDIPDGLQSCHHCDNRKCIRPSHLFIGTQFENIQDAKSKGRLAAGDKLPDLRGEKAPFAKLTWDQVREIRRINPYGNDTTRLAATYGVSSSNVRKILAGLHWKEDVSASISQ